MLGGLLASLLGSYLGLSSIFTISSLIILSALIFGVNIRSLGRERKNIEFSEIVQVAKSKVAWLISPFFLVTFAMYAVALTFLALTIKNYGVGYVGIMFTVFHLGTVALGLTIGKIVDIQDGRYQDFVIYTGIGLGLFGCVLLLLNTSLVSLFLATVLLTVLFSVGNIVGNNLVGIHFPESRWEAAHGFLRIPASLGTVIPLLAEGFIAERGSIYVSLLFGVLALFGIYNLKNWKIIRY